MNKMAIFPNISDTAIALIGRYDTTDPTSCLVKVIGNASSWRYRIYFFPDTTETLTDIAITDKSLVTASRFGGETTTFGLRYIDPYVFFQSNNITDYETLNKFNTQNLLIDPPLPPSTAWHRNNAIIRLVPIPSSNNVIVGQECHYITNNQGYFNSYIHFYLIKGDDPSNITMNKALRYFCAIQDPDVLYELRYIPDKYNSKNDKIVILEKAPNSQSCPGNLDIISWDNNSLLRYFNGWIVPSALDIAPNNHVWVGGVNKADNTIVQYCQDITTDYSCLLTEPNSLHTLSSMPENNTYIRNIEERDIWNIYWKYKDRSVPTITPYELLCIIPLDD